MYNNIIELKGVSKTYPSFSLQDISFEVPRGCIMGLIGENGAGKSTIIKLILDLISKESGEIRVLGSKEVGSDISLREHIGVVLDEASFVDSMTAQEVNTVMRKMYKTWDSGKFFGLCNRFNLPQKIKVKDFSRGMKMKLSIATALSHDSTLLLLDEATSGLDPMVRDEILDILLEFIQDENHGVLISSHILSDLEKVCDYITFVSKGRLVLTEEKDELLHKYVIVKCPISEAERLENAQPVAVRKSAYGVSALMTRDNVPSGMVCDKAMLEDIMLYFIKGDAS